ncbi:MAG: hypothetical protein HYX71_03450 [Opitutae bacterium]|nr:hypothetical protein [Opitutae bacterium]
MRTPFVRPFFAKFFYWYAGISTALSVLVLLFFPAILRALVGPELGQYFNAMSGVMILVMLASGLAVAASGYVIELIAKIEWNTRPNAGGSGQVLAPASGPAGSIDSRQYFLSEKGRVTGPLNAAELLTLYRDGKISIAAQISVEESGQRRLLKNLSEIGL